MRRHIARCSGEIKMGDAPDPLREDRRTQMVKMIHRQAGIRTIFDEDGHLQQFEEFGPNRVRISRERWPDLAGAKKAFRDGLLTWGRWIDPNGEIPR